GYKAFYKRTELEASEFVKDDCLTIQCTVGVVKTSMDSFKMFAQLPDLGEFYGQLLDSKEGSDVSFKVEGEIFYAHKLILSTRSPVFKAQFFGPLKEKKTRCIKIEEMHAPVFKALLHFIYCDAIPDVGEVLAGLDANWVTTTITQHLLAAADRYGIERLKSLCELRLCENISIDTVAASLALAEQHGCFQLKSTCLEFIGLPENLEVVIQTDGFKNLEENCPDVMDVLFKSVPRLRDYLFVSNGPGYSLTMGMGIGKYISSDTFFVGGHSWKILFSPDEDGNKNDESGDSNVSLFIKLVSKCAEDVRIFLECVLLDQSGDKWYKSTSGFYRMPKDGSEMYGPQTLNNVGNTFGFKSFCKRSELEASQFLKDDCLTIQCTVGVVKTSLDVPKTFAQPLPLSDLGQSYVHLLESRDGSDLSFEVEGETFYAHKLILSTRSPVFKAQFFGPLKEENTTCIKIEEMHAPVFKVLKFLCSFIALLHFIYCDVIPDLDSTCVDTTMTQHLLVAADRYGIEKLKSLCEARLCENVAIDTVASSLALAVQHGCIQLRSTCLEFIGLPENLEGVMQTNGFRNLKESCPAVIDELLKSVARVRDYSCVSYGPVNRR
ncbi:hypothetical protein RD792_017259, partial [Penstemon davidsonii]